MAMKPLRPCRKVGCCELVSGGYCQAHKPKEQRSREASDWHRLYNLPVWRDRLRPEQLLLEPYCRGCARDGRRTRATVVDHVIPHRGDFALFADGGNLQSLCKRCHDRKTALEMRENRRK